MHGCVCVEAEEMTHKKRNFYLTITLLLLVIIGVRASMSTAVTWYVNKKLDEPKAYHGEVGDIDLHLLRGAYEIENIKIVKISGEQDIPLFSAKKIELSILWKALLKGNLVGKAELFAPEINIIDSKKPERAQTGKEASWLDVISDLFPLRMDRILIHNGSLHFRNIDKKPAVDVFIADLQASLINFTNSSKISGSLLASLEIRGTVMHDAKLNMAAQIDPFAEQHHFDVNGELTGLNIMALDNLIKTYAPFDIEAGKLDLFWEIAAEKGYVEGYIKPIIENIDVFSWKEDVKKEGDNPLQVLWENIVGSASQLFRNQKTHRLATKIPFTGRIDNPQIGVWSALVGIIKNAFVHALESKPENLVDLPETELPKNEHSKTENSEPKQSDAKPPHHKK